MSTRLVRIAFWLILLASAAVAVGCKNNTWPMSPLQPLHGL
jgi:hypothetical protein